MKIENNTKSEEANNCDCNIDDVRLKVFKNLFNIDSNLIDHLDDMNSILRYDLDCIFNDMIRMMVYWRHSNDYEGAVMFEPKFFLTPFKEESFEGKQLIPVAITMSSADTMGDLLDCEFESKLLERLMDACPSYLLHDVYS